VSAKKAESRSGADEAHGTERKELPMVLYAEAIRIALNNIESAIATMTALGYAVSAHISRGKIVSIGVAPNN
jgi:hypothetical protein